MNTVYYTRHATTPMVETIFSNALHKFGEVFRQSSARGSAEPFRPVLHPKLLTYVMEQTAEAADVRLPQHRTEALAVSFLAFAAVFRAAATCHRRTMLDVLIPEEYERVIFEQADRQELRSDLRFFLILAHVSLGELCREQEEGKHSLSITNPASATAPLLIDAKFLLNALAGNFASVIQQSETQKPEDSLEALACLLCAYAGALLSLLATSEA